MREKRNVKEKKGSTSLDWKGLVKEWTKLFISYKGGKTESLIEEEKECGKWNNVRNMKSPKIQKNIMGGRFKSPHK